jgi:hypothetical protein
MDSFDMLLKIAQMDASARVAEQQDGCRFELSVADGRVVFRQSLESSTVSDVTMLGMKKTDSKTVLVQVQASIDQAFRKNPALVTQDCRFGVEELSKSEIKFREQAILDAAKAKGISAATVSGSLYSDSLVFDPKAPKGREIKTRYLILFDPAGE